MPIHSPIARLLELARKRDILNLALDKGALALGLVMGGAIALLLAGTDILSWYWLLLLAAASLAAGVYLLRKSLASRYLLAQRIDRKLELKDAISTAYYFSEHPEPTKAAICASQLREAETAAAQVDVKLALPLSRSRYVVPAIALAAVAFGLFAARYLISGTLDLKASLVQVVYDNFFSNKAEARNQLPPRAKFEPQVGNPNQENNTIEADKQPEDLLDSQESTDSANANEDNSKTEADQGDKKKGNSSGKDQGKEDNSGKGDQSQDQKDQQGNDSKNGNPNQDGKQSSKSSSGSQKNQSMLDKMKDALSNMIDKLKQEASQGGKDQDAQKSDQKQDQGEKGSQSKDEQSQAQANGDQGQQTDGKRSSDASNDKQASKQTQSQDSKNGIGSQDGEKAIKQAEQLQAMGKITEILGKRSAAVSGEVMVEVGSSKQQLKTQWAQRDATHSNSGGEIHRDEIPLTEQQFIERYFEEVHKSSTPAPSDSTQPKKSGGG